MVRPGTYIVLALWLASFPAPAAAQQSALLLSGELEVLRLGNVGAAWRTVEPVNSYTSPVVACTYVLPSAASNDAAIRLRNVGTAGAGGGFDVRVQRFETSNAVSASDVHCMVAESGAHTLPDGRAFEAGTVLSTVTNGNAAGWTAGQSNRIDNTIATSFANPVVFGSVMSFNDPRASAFWTWDGANRRNPPTGSAIWIGKHIGMINGTRASETLGYIVFEEGAGTANGVAYQVRQGPNSIAGTGNNPPYTYTVSGDLDIAVATQAAENGGNGGWAVLYGADPLPPGGLQLAVEEEVVAGDTTRTHINEEVFWFGAERTTQAENLEVSKTVAVHPDSASGFFIPGGDALYTITLSNTGDGVPDSGTLFLYDALPAEVEFNPADANGAGVPGTDPVAVSFSAGSGMALGAVGYRNAAGAPASMADCTDGPSAAARYVCVDITGQPAPGSSAQVLIRVTIP